ncbi:hypothetical protein SELMODRAFT_406567 [Selaginella moellendorffii]|uniref:Uncharacterized protein n=1 Tax=Selaginella moellendorffii TaxID=88036 RepID=D8R2T6_SELML|nr:hypothetical protein SELMODRAFT_406567 [Selaginella moellendorffii]
MENLGVKSERRYRILRKGIKELSKVECEYDKLMRFAKEKRLVGQYVNTMYNAVAQDPDMAHLLGLLYIHQHWDLFQDFISDEVFQTARQILQDPCSPQLARRFLDSAMHCCLITLLSAKRWIFQVKSLVNELNPFTRPSRMI